MKVSEGFPSSSELRSLLQNKLNHIKVTETKEAMMQSIKETIPEASKLGFQAGNTIIKCAFFRFLKMASMDMIQQVALNTIRMKSFDPLSHSNAFKNAIVDNVSRHPELERPRCTHGPYN